MNHSRALAVITAKAVLGSSLALGLLLTPHATARADDTVNVYRADGIDYVKLSELHHIDMMPTCQLEDGSDIDPALLPCIWGNEGTAWLTYADVSYPIVDETDGDVSDLDLGA